MSVVEAETEGHNGSWANTTQLRLFALYLSWKKELPSVKDIFGQFVLFKMTEGAVVEPVHH